MISFLSGSLSDVTKLSLKSVGSGLSGSLEIEAGQAE